jgi:hypothetical protein
MKKSLALPYFPMYSFPAMNTPTVITFDIASQIVNLSKKIGKEQFPNDLTLRLAAQVGFLQAQISHILQDVPNGKRLKISKDTLKRLAEDA